MLAQEVRLLKDTKVKKMQKEDTRSSRIKRIRSSIFLNSTIQNS